MEVNTMDIKHKILSKDEYLELRKANKMIYVDSLKATLRSLGENPKGMKKRECLALLDSIATNQTIAPEQSKNLTNDEDFFTFDKLDTIPPERLMIIEEDGYYYGFDIYSFKMLSEKNNFNPYTRKKLKKSDILICNLRLKDLDKHEDAAANSHPEMTPEQLFNDSVLKIFQKMDELNVVASGTHPRWFTELSFSQLRSFYKVLFDVWTYRTQLSQSQRDKIVPNKNVFRQFTYSISHITDKRKLQQTILKDMDTLVSSGISQEDKATGCYYILIALTEVSAQVAQELPWLVQY
jgi:hypothetical protein